jgi:magnesium transporter/zinc transporter
MQSDSSLIGRGDWRVPITGRSPAPGLVWAYRFDEEGRGHPMAYDEPIDLTQPGEGFRWLHLNLVDQRSCQWIATHPALPPAARELMTTSDHHQRVVVTDRLLAAVFYDFGRSLDRGSAGTARLHIVLGDRFLLGGRRQPIQATDATRQAVEEGLLTRSPAALLETIVTGVADAAADVTATQIEDSGVIEDRLLIARGSDDARKLATTRRSIVHLHRQLGGTRAIFHRIERESTDRLPQTLLDAAARIAQRLDSLDSDLVALQQQARLLQEEIDSKLSAKINRQLYVLSIIAALFLPPSVVAGIFGMNVGGLPMLESRFGFVVAMLLIVASPALVYLALWASGMLRR